MGFFCVALQRLMAIWKLGLARLSTIAFGALCVLGASLAAAAAFALKKRRKRLCDKDLLAEASDPVGSEDIRTADVALPDLVSVILTTSAVPSHPSTYLLDETLKSMSLANGLTSCSLLIVCDGYKSCPEGVESRCRMGIINPDLASRYDEYKRRLRERE